MANDFIEHLLKFCEGYPFVAMVLQHLLQDLSEISVFYLGHQTIEFLEVDCKRIIVVKVAHGLELPHAEDSDSKGKDCALVAETVADCLHLKYFESLRSIVELFVGSEVEAILAENRA